MGKRNIDAVLRSLVPALLFLVLSFVSNASETIIWPAKQPYPDDTAKVASPASPLDKDEGIKCTREELTSREFVVKCSDKYGELLRITYQDLERGGREIIFQKKMVLDDEVKFFMPFELVKEAKTCVLIVMKGSGMFFKKIDITD